MSFSDPSPGGAARAPWAWALALATAWLVVAGAVWASLGALALAAGTAVLLPPALIGLAAAQARGAGAARAEGARLRADLDALRGELRALAAADREGREDRRRPAPEPAPPPPPAEVDPAPPAERPRAPSLGAPDLIRALDFPEDAEDADGFEALRRALADPEARRLVQASQDVLTLLSQNGVYMDDLDARPGPPALWRRFAGGVRGAGVADLAGVRDEAALELAGARMMRDTIFRDAAHHFLRQFDLGLQRFVTRASDDEVAALSHTRTARAFMLVARAAGTFD